MYAASYRGSKLMVAIALYHGILMATRVNEVGSGTAILDEQPAGC